MGIMSRRRVKETRAIGGLAPQHNDGPTEEQLETELQKALNQQGKSGLESENKEPAPKQDGWERKKRQKKGD